MTVAGGYRQLMRLNDWAFDVAQSKLEHTMPQRWDHVQGVARKARSVRAVAGPDADLLEAAAVLHDVGYAPDLAKTGFHPVDGAVFLAEAGAPDRLVSLVAHHSCARLEAQMRGLEHDLARFEDEQGPVRDALWYCDQTTSPAGEPITAQAGVAEIKHRYGPGHLVTRFITEAAYPPRPYSLPWERPEGRPHTCRLLFRWASDDQHVKARSYSEIVWKPAAIKAGIIPEPEKDARGRARYVTTRKEGIHQLRHYYASVMLAGGVSIKKLAEYLGHADPAFTLRVYAHLLPSSHARARQVIDERFTQMTARKNADGAETEQATSEPAPSSSRDGLT
jgi:putative nucleotidyltransferase with HDIG domain